MLATAVSPLMVFVRGALEDTRPVAATSSSVLATFSKSWLPVRKRHCGEGYMVCGVHADCLVDKESIEIVPMGWEGPGCGGRLLKVGGWVGG
jgi:hypothetical protein